MTTAPPSPHTADAPAPALPRSRRILRAAALTAGLSVILVGMLLLFIMPTLKSGPHHLEVGVVAADPAAEQIEAALSADDPEAFDPIRFDTSDDLDRAIRRHEISGGFDLSSPGTVRTAVASAGSTAVSGTLTQIGRGIAESSGAELLVDDVVALPAADPTGTGIGGLAFPLVFGGIVPAVAFRSLPTGHRPWILGGILGFSAVGDLIVSAVLENLFGSTSGVLWPVAGAMALGIAALAVPLSGLAEAFGTKGFTLAAMVMMFIGNPFTGIATSSVWLPGPIAALGQLLSPGAAGTLVRAVACFDGHGAGGALLTLSCWVAAGLALWAIAPLIRLPRRRSVAPKAS